MIHAATMAYRGHAIALPAAGGTGKTSTVAKLMRRDGWSFMGDDWAFLAEDATLLGYAKPMFIKPHHRAIYPHLFEGVRKPLIPSRLSQSVGRLTTVVHPYVIRYPRLADFFRRWSPEHRMVVPGTAFPGREVTTSAPLAAVVYIERFEGAQSRVVERSNRVDGRPHDRQLPHRNVGLLPAGRDRPGSHVRPSVARALCGEGDRAEQGARRTALLPAAGARRVLRPTRRRTTSSGISSTCCRRSSTSRPEEATPWATVPAEITAVVPARNAETHAPALSGGPASVRCCRDHRRGRVLHRPHRRPRPRGRCPGRE